MLSAVFAIRFDSGLNSSIELLSAHVLSRYDSSVKIKVKLELMLSLAMMNETTESSERKSLSGTAVKNSIKNLLLTQAAKQSKI